MEDKNYCPNCRAFLTSEPHKPMCKLKAESVDGPVGHKEIVDPNYFSISGRMAVLIEEALHRGRKIQAVTISADNSRFYGNIFWTEGQ